jgi:hypothetical protein
MWVDVVVVVAGAAAAAAAAVALAFAVYTVCGQRRVVSIYL